MANFTYFDTQVNKAVGDDAPNEYFGRVVNQCNGGELTIGNVVTMDALNSNLEENAMPENILDMTVEDYDEFKKMIEASIEENLKRYDFGDAEYLKQCRPVVIDSVLRKMIPYIFLEILHIERR